MPKRSLSPVDFNELYKKVFAMVEDGIAVNKALISLGQVSTAKFYATITLEQKKELRTASILTKRYTVVPVPGMTNSRDTEEIENFLEGDQF